MNVFISGSGTLATELVEQLKDNAEVKKIVIYSRDEGKHAKLRQEYKEGPPSKLRYRIGDIRDVNRLTEAMADCDTVIHTAAMKRIDDCANHVQECVKTNVIGTLNIINACHKNYVETALFISTDKACSPISAYGTSKLMAEHLWIHANSKLKTEFAICRYGNVIGSRGSVFHLWKQLGKDGKDIPVTDKEMTRFFWDISEAAQFAIETIFDMQPGVIYVPKMYSHKMWDIASSYGKPYEIGLRTPEKIHEEMVSIDEISSAYDQGERIAIYPCFHQWSDKQEITGTQLTEPYSSDLHRYGTAWGEK